VAFFWFLAGVLSALAALVLILPWLRTIPRFDSLPAIPWQAPLAAAVLVTASLGLYQWLAHRETAVQPSAPAAANDTRMARAFSAAASTFADATDPSRAPPSNPAPSNLAAQSAAGPMGNAIANLQARLAKGGGTADDWELLAKSYEFLGRPQEAAKARAHQLPLMPRDDDSAAAEPVRAPANAPASAPGKSVSGEVSLAATLSAKAAAGATLFIVAKSVDSPGPPVAVFRGSVGTWPVNFTLDDSQSMLPGRNLSNAGRVTIEARISRSGQPLPAAGDLQGSSGVINPADRQPLKIIINKVIT